jgi:hypothetical protein
MNTEGYEDTSMEQTPAHLLLGCLFNDAVPNLDCIASSVWTISYRLMRKDVDRNNGGVIWGTISKLACMAWRKLR